MTKEEKLAAFKLRLEGKTYAEISEIMKLNMSKQALQTALAHPKPIGRPASPCVYPGLQSWLDHNHETFHEMCVRSDLFEGSRVDSHRITNWNTGYTKFNMMQIHKVLKHTGLSFDEAFGEYCDGMSVR